MSDNAYLAPHDGVPYSVFIHLNVKIPGVDEIDDRIDRRNKLIKRHHEQVKAVYHFLRHQFKTDAIQVRIVCGPDLGVWFLTEKQILATMMMSMFETSNRVHGQYLDIMQALKVNTVAVFHKKHTPIFRKLKVPGITVRRETKQSPMHI
jgi:hypothetical protein